MKKDFKELDLNQGPPEYQIDALEGMTMGTSHNQEQYLMKYFNFYYTQKLPRQSHA